MFASQNPTHYKLHSMQKSQKTILKISFLAAFAYGSWAVFVNYDHGMMVWMKAGLAQASSSFLMTFFITNIAHGVCHKMGYGKKGISLGYFSTIIVMVAVPYTTHTISGTPRIWASMAPGLIWGSIYITSYLVTIDRKQRIDANERDKAGNS